MRKSQEPAWDPLRIIRIHRLIARCSFAARPKVLIFHGQLPRGVRHPLLAVFPSSFNPPTKAHEEIVSWALRSNRFHCIVLLLDVHHADKPMEDAVLEDRAMMMRIAFGGWPSVALGICSHGRFVDKLRALDTLLPEARWTFLVGDDAMGRILDPRFYEDPDRELTALFQSADFVVFSRPSVKGSQRKDGRAPLPCAANLLYKTLREEIGKISSREIRFRRKQGLPLPPWVSSPILSFLDDTGLYLDASAHPPLYPARKRLFEHLFQNGPEAFSGIHMKQEALRTCERLRPR